MNTYTKEEIKLAKKLAYNYIYGWHFLRSGRAFNYDGRTRVGKLANTYVSNLKLNVNKSYILNLQKERRENTYRFTNILDNPLVRDLLVNKNNVRHWNDNHVNFYGGRNHWVKSDVDLKIIKIFKKYNY